MGNIVFFDRKGGLKMTSIFDVARFFLSKNSMSHLKLQKMCYYSQAWYLAIFNKRLFNEAFQAWLHGPVSPKLYRHYAQWKFYEISQYTGTVDLDTGIEIFLEMIYEIYGGYSGGQLEELTHSEDPWIQARDGAEEYCTNIISDDSMAEYYKNMLLQTIKELEEVKESKKVKELKEVEHI